MGKNKGEMLIQQNNKNNSHVFRIVFLRTFTVMYVLFSAILMTMSLILRPWKQEFKKPGDSKSIEFSVWNVCRATHKGSRCYSDQYKDLPAWFLSFRWLLVLSVIIQYLSLFYLLIRTLLRGNSEMIKFWIAGWISLLSSLCGFLALIILVIHWPFEFMEETRKYKMGWVEDHEAAEKAGYPYIMAWCAWAMIFTGAIICFYVHFVEKRFANKYKQTRLQNETYRAVYGNR